MKKYRLEERISLLHVRKKWALRNAIVLLILSLISFAAVMFMSCTHGDEPASFALVLLSVMMPTGSLVVSAMALVDYRIVKVQLELLDALQQIIIANYHGVTSFSCECR